MQSGGFILEAGLADEESLSSRVPMTEQWRCDSPHIPNTSPGSERFVLRYPDMVEYLGHQVNLLPFHF